MIYDELLKAVTDNEPDNYRLEIERANKWEYLYNLSPIRANLIKWLPISKGDSVLEIGAECGALTQYLCEMAANVTAIEASECKAKVNMARNSKADNLTVLVGDVKEQLSMLEKSFDYVLLAGYEALDAYIIKLAKNCVKADGRIIVATSNRLGLKYFAGCKEESKGDYFVGIEGEGNAYSKSGLTNMLKAADIKPEEMSFYYPYPDLYFPNTIFSDEWGPKTGELYHNLRNFDDERLILFDETKAFDALIREGKFAEFSNAYMVVIGPKIDVKYSRFSNDRAYEYCIRTDITLVDNKWTVYKTADNDKANAHIEDMLANYEKLSDKYADTGLSFNRIEKAEGTRSKIKCEFVKGVTLEELLDNALYKNDKEEFIRLFKRYTDWINNAKEEGIYDLDLIFPNIIMNDKGPVAIDYEWTREEYSKDKLIARALYCYIQGNNDRARLKEWIDISVWQDLLLEAESEEINIQKFVMMNRLALYQLRYTLGHEAYSLEHALERIHSSKLPVRIYTDIGMGITEALAFNVENAKRSGDRIEFEINIEPSYKKLRIDPGDNPCLMMINSISIDGEDKTDELLSLKGRGIRYHNGKKIGKRTFLFKKMDPHISFNTDCTKDGLMHRMTVNMTVNPISEEISKHL